MSKSSNKTEFTAIASKPSTPSTTPRGGRKVSTPGNAPDGLNEVQMMLHDLSFKNPPSQVVERDPEAKEEGFYFNKWLDESITNLPRK